MEKSTRRHNGQQAAPYVAIQHKRVLYVDNEILAPETCQLIKNLAGCGCQLYSGLPGLVRVSVRRGLRGPRCAPGLLLWLRCRSWPPLV